MSENENEGENESENKKLIKNSLIVKSILAGTKNSHLEGFFLAKHKHTNIPTMTEPFPPSSSMVLTEEHTPPPRASSQGVG